MSAPHTLKIPPISALAASVSESWVWKLIARETPFSAASRQPATPVTNEASANAQSL
jgi:hypothetical protein